MGFDTTQERQFIINPRQHLELLSCYHGVIDVKTVLERLSHEKIGTFLLWKYKNTNNDLVLTLSSKCATEIKHVKIKSSYIVGQEFSSVPDIIEYYTSTPIRCGGEEVRLKIPLQGDTYKQGKPTGEENDSLLYEEILDEDESYEQIDTMLERDLPLESYRWYHGKVSQKYAVQKLENEPAGTFFVCVDSDTGKSVLYVRQLTVPHRTRIKRIEILPCYRVSKNGMDEYSDAYTNIAELIQRLSENHFTYHHFGKSGFLYVNNPLQIPGYYEPLIL